MTTTIIWQIQDKSNYGIEYFSLEAQMAKNIMRGTVILLLNDNPALIKYVIATDSNWKTRSVEIRQQTSNSKIRNLCLKIDHDQNWKKNTNEPSSDSFITLDFASGLNDVDLQITPSTNTLPINRIALKEGESQEIDIVLISFPELTPSRQQQKYSRIDEKFYRFEVPSIGFIAKLEVDKLGLVVNYDTIWSRLN